MVSFGKTISRRKEKLKRLSLNFDTSYVIRVLTLHKISQLTTRNSNLFTNFAFMNNLGNFLTLSTFGESHGIAYGGIITNFPAGIEINFEEIQHQLDRRKPGQSSIVTQRKRK